jgi:hypothetical protein
MKRMVFMMDSLTGPLLVIFVPPRYNSRQHNKPTPNGQRPVYFIQAYFIHHLSSLLQNHWFKLKMAVFVDRSNASGLIGPTMIRNLFTICLSGAGKLRPRQERTKRLGKLVADVSRSSQQNVPPRRPYTIDPDWHIIG